MNRNPKILFIMPLPPPVHGSSMMCDYIRQSGKIKAKFNCDYVNLSTSRSIDEIGHGGVKKYFRLMIGLFKTFWKLTTKRPDLCYLAITCHGGGFLKDAPFALLCKLFGKKLIIHQHNKGMSRDVDKPLFRHLFKVVYRNATVILLSERLYPDIREIVEHSQVSICPNGIPNLSGFSSSPKKNNETIRLLFLSNLIPSKGVLTLLDAMQILKNRGVDLQCDFVGGESKEINRETFEKEVHKRSLDKNVFYLGKKYGEEKAEIFKQHDIFVFPTYYDNECFPLVLLEAMQAGMPCISTDEGAIPDLLDGTGLIVPPRDPEELANAIDKLVKDKDLYLRLSRNAQDRFNSNYTLDMFEQNILKCLMRI